MQPQRVTVARADEPDARNVRRARLELPIDLAGNAQLTPVGERPVDGDALRVPQNVEAFVHADVARRDDAPDAAAVQLSACDVHEASALPERHTQVSDTGRVPREAECWSV